MNAYVVPRSRYKENGDRIRPCGKRGSAFRRELVDKIVKQTVFDSHTKRFVKAEYEVSYHATKGWRTKRKVL